ncbi:MLH1 protein, partial [Acromyrmex heyeri]
MAIILLDTKTINRIAAGEVIERLASVVKELAENAIDAGSSEIEIKIESGGRNSVITVTDNGNGIEKDDLELAFMRHATSKLSDSELIEIKHLGFRGKALPSIAAVSRIRLSSKAKRVNEAWSISYEGGEKIGEIIPCSLLEGTYIEIRDLFFATSNRLKFLKTERAETQAIVDIVNNLAMINYSIGFTLTSGNKKLLKYAKQTSLFNRLREIEEEFQSNSLEVKEEGVLFGDSKSQGNDEQVNSKEKKNQKEFYEKRPSLLENRLMKEFNKPDERKQSLSETFKYGGMDKSPPQFSIEIQSKDKVKVKEIPAILGTINIKEMLIDIVDRLKEMEGTLPIEDKVNKMLATIACHREGRKMKLEEMNELLRQMEETAYSDHGRPTYIEMKLNDIEKLFERR